MARRYWLFKSEPSAYSLDDLRNEPGQRACWDGVRNYQARNLMRDEMKVGDRLLFYHSAIKVPAAVGTAEIVREAYPDHTQFDPRSPYYDARSSPDQPRWLMVDIRFLTAFAEPVSLPQIRRLPELSSMLLLKKGCRLSLQPVEPEAWKIILDLGRGKK